MVDSLTTEHAYLSATSFPVLVLTEAGVVTDSERTAIIEYLELLLDQGQRHSLVIDLTQGVAMPDTQRIYVADALQMRAKAIANTWGGIAMVVGGKSAEEFAKAEFWLGVSPVPAQAFSTLDAAMAWASAAITNPASTNPAARRTSVPTQGRPSRTVPSWSGAPRDKPTARVSLGSPVRDKPPARPDLERFLGRLKTPRGRAAMAATGCALLLLWFSPADGKLSAADRREFERLKAGLTLRMHRQDARKTEPMKVGQQYHSGDVVTFEMDIPANGYLALANVKAGRTIRPVSPEMLSQEAGQIRAAKSVRLPLMFKLDSAKGHEKFAVVYCPSPFSLGDCAASDGLELTCPEGCVTSDFAIRK